MDDYKLEPLIAFHKKIEAYYFGLANNQIPIDLLKELVNKITDSQHHQYELFWNQYPKSRKRYSELKLEDLEHPFTHYDITDFLKGKSFQDYKKYAMLLLKMTENEFSEFEIKKYQYETK